MINENLTWFKWDSLSERHNLNIKLIKEFYEKNKYLPKRPSTDKNEEKLASYLHNCKQDYKKKEIKVEVYNLIISNFPFFVWDDIYEKNRLAVEKLVTFYNIYNEPPKYKGLRENENSCYIYYAHLRNNKKNNNLPEYLEKLINEKCHWIIWNPIEEQILEKIIKLKEFYEINNREPTDGRLDSTLEENRLSYFIQDARRNMKKNKLNPYIKENIEKYLHWFKWIKD